MAIDNLLVSMICGSFVLGPVAALIVGSQDRADARWIAVWSDGVLGLLLLAECARVVAGRAEPTRDRLGFLVFYSALIAAVGWGYQIAALRAVRSERDAPDIKTKPDPWEDELA